MTMIRYLMCCFVLAAIASAGCEGLTSAPQPLVSVLKRSDEGCFSLMTPATPVAGELAVSGTCSYQSEPHMLAGIDLVEVVVDYGPDVSFAGNTQAPSPTIVLTVDGAQSDEPIDISQEQRVGGRAFFVATFRAPHTISTNMKLVVGVNPGFQTAVPITFSLVAAPVELIFVDCLQGITCQLPGAVGSAHIMIAVPGDVPQTVAIHTTIDGLVQPDPIPAVITRPVGTHTEESTALPIPAVHDGAVWVVSAQLGTAPPSQVTAIIRAPMITSALSCGSTCSLARGQTVGLTITTPAGIRPLQALVDTRINGVPQLVAAPVALVQNADGTATGALALTAPMSTGPWQIDASVAGYFAPAVVTNIP